jgi:hypothetical protein
MSAAASLACALDAATARLRADLVLEDLYAGLPRGAVGRFASDGSPQFAYPEIAGYWLRWCASQPELDAAPLLDWLAATRDDEGFWPTRLAVTGAPLDDEWQTLACLFDHAMLWDGLQQLAGRRGCRFARDLAQDLRRTLATFASEGALLPVHVVVPATLPPSQHWSRNGGPFLLKACARLRGVDDALGRVAVASVGELAGRALWAPHHEAHPQLYAVEGLLELGYINAARMAFSALMVAYGGPSGLREQVHGGPRRSDVLAQALRVAAILGVTDASWRSLTAELVARVDENGRLPFAEAGSPHHRDCPTWASLFALQALEACQGRIPQPKDLV